MSTQKISSQHQFVAYALIILYLCLGFVPNWGAVDKIAPQWLSMSILNTLAGVWVLIYHKAFGTFFREVSQRWVTLCYFGFIVWAGLSYFYAINPTEVLLNLGRQFNTFFMFFFIAIYLQLIPKKFQFISVLLSIILAVEVYAVLTQVVEMYQANTFNSGNLKGVTANRNITAFSIAGKIPFALYLAVSLKRKLWKTVFTFLVFLGILCLTFIDSRASYIALLLMLVVFASINLFRRQRSQQMKPIIQILLLILPLILAVGINQIYFSNRNDGNIIRRASTISVTKADGSITKRLRYYSSVAKQIKSSPIIGVGLGNWKLKSIYYDRNDISGYIVPYHAHSDFIQLGAELGILGFLLYFGIFVITGIYLLRILARKDLPDDQLLFYGLCLAYMGVYFIDSNLNFPIARPQVLAPLTLVLAIVSWKGNPQPKENRLLKRFTISAMVVPLLLVAPTVHVNNMAYKSLQSQLVLLRDFNSNQYSLTLNEVEQALPPIPNITVTTIPLASVKARYYYNAKKYNRALELLNQGSPANPYLFYSEIMKAQIYRDIGVKDSALFYSKKAFYNLPGNALHASVYMSQLLETSDIKEMEVIYEKIKKSRNESLIRNYFAIAVNMNPPKTQLWQDRIAEAVAMFPANSDLKSFQRILVLSPEESEKAAQLSNQGQQLYAEKNFFDAIQLFEEACRLDPFQYQHFENAGLSYFSVGDYTSALRKLDTVINVFKAPGGKSEYVKALVYLNLGQKDKACEWLKIAALAGFEQAKAEYRNRCVNQ
ncbi:MAG: O-antigen ligase family protein [Flavobacteriaceae bacterium]